jgi:hypothetical protein
MFRRWALALEPTGDFNTGQQREGIAVAVMAMELIGVTENGGPGTTVWLYS